MRKAIDDEMWTGREPLLGASSDSQDSCMSDEHGEASEEDPEIDLDDAMQIMTDSAYEIPHLCLGVMEMDLTTKYLIFLADPLP